MPNSWQKPGLLKLVLIFCLLTAGIGVTGYGYLQKQLEHVKREKLNDLAVIAGLKANQIAEWRKERLAEAKSILATSFMPPSVERWLAGGRRDAGLRDSLLAWMAAPRYMRHYSRIFLLDAQGKVMLSFPDGGVPPGSRATACALDALSLKSVILQDLHLSDDGKTPYLNLCAPLVASRPGALSGEIGVLVFEIAPTRFLYPLIQSWPTPSPSAETLLVRREGDSVLYLNELRHGKAPALSLFQPLSDAALPSVRAVLGEEGAVEGRDYRGIEVLAALRKIPNSPWFMVAKIDHAEVVAPLRERIAMVVSVSAALIALSAFAVILLWRQQQMRFNLARHEFEEEVLHQANIELELRVAERTCDLQAEIAQHRLTESALQKSLEDLTHSNADLEQFAYVASHDLQEPLRMVASFVQLLARRYRDKLDQDAHDFIGYAVEGVTRMQRLIDDLLSYSLVGSDSGDLEETDCNQALAEVLMNLRPLIEENHAVVTQDILPTVSAKHSQISQLLQNLIGNAIKFHGEKTPEIHVSARRDGACWTFSVRDNGIGIAPEYFDKIFMIFKRLHSREKYPGTGIGLAICKRIVERHHGRIWAESSEVGNGTTFYFTIPILLEARD